MSSKLFGGIDLATWCQLLGPASTANSIINTEFRIGILERVIDHFIRAAPPKTLTQEDIENIRIEVFESLKKKFPDAGIECAELEKGEK